MVHKLVAKVGVILCPSKLGLVLAKVVHTFIIYEFDVVVVIVFFYLF